MKIDLDITTKGLVLISIPIISELVLVCSLVFMVNRADDIALSEHRKKELVLTVHEVGMQVYEQVNLLMGYYATHEQKLLAKFSLIDQEILSHLQYIETALALAPGKESEQKRARFHRVSENLMREVRECRDQSLRLMNNTDASRWLNVAADLRVECGRFLSATDELLEFQTRSDGRRTPDNELQQARDAVRYLLVGALLFNITIAIYLSVFFSRGISRRVTWICQNIESIPAGVTLKEPLKGTDELSTIDRFVHSVDEQLKEKDRQRSAIVSMVGHDLRTPLSAAQISLQMMAKGGYGELSDRVRTKVESNVAVLETLTRMIRDLLDTETLRAGKFEIVKNEVDLKDVCLDAQSALSSLVESRKLSLQLNCASVRGMFDADRMLQVLNNLIGNAVKFSPPGGIIRVTLEKGGDEAVLQIDDDGPGISDEDIGKVFERFYQTMEGRRVAGSMGLGLHICKEIVAKHGGRIGVERLPQGGSRFWIRLPLSGFSEGVEPR